MSVVAAGIRVCRAEGGCSAVAEGPVPVRFRGFEVIQCLDQFEDIAVVVRAESCHQGCPAAAKGIIRMWSDPTGRGYLRTQGDSR